MKGFPKQVYSIEGSAKGHYTITGIIGSRTYHNTKEREAVKTYVRECNGEATKRTPSVRSGKRKREKLIRCAESN